MAKRIINGDGTVSYTGVIIEGGKPDGEGNVIDLQGITISSNLVLTKNFDRGFKQVNNLKPIIGVVNSISFLLESGPITADITLFEDLSTHLYPAIGGVVLERDGKVIKKSLMNEISFSWTKNADGSIGSLRQQTTEESNHKRPQTVRVNGVEVPVYEYEEGKNSKTQFEGM